MKLTSFELYQIQYLIDDKIKALKKELRKETNQNVRTDIDKYINDYRKTSLKILNLFQETLLSEIESQAKENEK
ncbi:hypothetical protein [Terrisporobacter sp.]|uniref:hypothetical protein n=1 Tax=Terrisporobacter sp. TaxID=1965305 RepID=UPI0028A27877|nr:hypothetical protein [Terrisporobacter sp.]